MCIQHPNQPSAFPYRPSGQLFLPKGASSFYCLVLRNTNKITSNSLCHCYFPWFCLCFYPSHFSFRVWIYLLINNDNQCPLLYLLTITHAFRRPKMEDYTIICAAITEYCDKVISKEQGLPSYDCRPKGLRLRSWRILRTYLMHCSIAGGKIKRKNERKKNKRKENESGRKTHLLTDILVYFP